MAIDDGVFGVQSGEVDYRDERGFLGFGGYHCHCMRESAREHERETETETDRQRHTDRESERDRESKKAVVLC